MMNEMTTVAFDEALQGLLRGDFSRLEPLFEEEPSLDACPIVSWLEEGRFRDHRQALNEALSCACFLGKTGVAAVLLSKGVEPGSGDRTGLDALHWAVNRGQQATVQLLLENRAALETENMYGHTVLGTAVWSAIHEPRPDHLAIIETLIAAGARTDAVRVPTGDERIDGILRRHDGRGSTKRRRG
jgi:Ankyrin repeats (3 copies)